MKFDRLKEILREIHVHWEAINDLTPPYIFTKTGYLLKVVQQNGFYSGKSYQEVEDKFLVRFTGKYY